MNDDNQNSTEGVVSSFSIPLAFYYNDSLTACLKDYILEQSVEGIASGVAPELKHGIIESDFNLVRTEDNRIKDVFGWFADKLYQTVNTVNGRQDKLDVFINESWYHITTTNGSHDLHNHPNCSWCGIYYVDAGDEGSGDTVFMNPLTSTFTDAGTKYLERMTHMYIKPQQGKLILFPSYLAHYQALYTGSKDRIVVAFNATLQIGNTNE